MSDDTNKDFANELIEKYGADRFYHCSNRTKSNQNKVYLGTNQTISVYLYLNENADKETCDNFFRSLGLQAIFWPSVEGTPFSKESFAKIQPREEMCRIAYGFCRYFKELGLRTYELPTHIHARMILGEKNDWVESYLKILEQYRN